MRIARFSPLFLTLALLAGCGSPATSASLSDLSIHIPPDLAPAGCTDDKSCKDPTGHCDVKSGQCVACTGDNHCPLGQVCTGGSCMAGCSMNHGCGDAGICDRDAGVCRSCMSDSDCGDRANPRCDVPSMKCVPCLPANDNCASGKYCAETNGVYACTPGCGKDSDCQGGGAVDGGANPDGGAMGGTMACCNHACADTASDNKNCKTCGNACMNGQSCCGQACADTTTDPNNCGSCGQACVLPNGATAACANSKCAIAKCQPGTADCDGNPKNGCEVNTNTDPNNCLGCGNTCIAAHAVVGCNMGCVISMCNNGFADCDSNFVNGCEVDVSSTVTDCGACKMACPKVMNGVPGCAMSQCNIASCDGSFADCNKMINDGCEVDTSIDPKNCGACGKVCGAVANGVAGCASGVCGLSACTGAFKDCNMNTQDGCEVDTSSDVANCGACGMACPGVPNGTAACIKGVCAIGSCNAGFKDCNGNLNDGCETNITNDIKNCSACSMVCPNIPNGSPICTMGVCGATGCNLPFKDCDGNPNNGCEVNTAIDVNNCGLCGNVCPAVNNGQSGCAMGKCGIGVCNMGFKDCNNSPNDGCETNIASDPLNCNGCGVKCSTPNGTPGCANGSCNIAACNQNFGDCNKNPQDGCEVNLLNDVNNCGGCGVVCPGIANGTAACLNGKCGVGSCNAPFKDCDGNPGNGCEANTSDDNNNCGACKNVCGGGTTCRNGQCSGCLNGGKAAPSACVAGNDPETGSPWVVCYGNCNNAVVSHNNSNGGHYHATQICQSLGYRAVGQFGGTCSNVCGYCQPATSCGQNGNLKFDGGGSCGSDGNGLILCNTVQWQCVI